MRLGVISDTHDNLLSLRQILNEFRVREVSTIIHLGDLTSPFTLRELLQYPARIIIILGNNDGDKLLLRELAHKAGAVVKDSIHEFSIGNRKVIAFHGWGTKDFTKRLAHALALSGFYDIVLYGHTHELSVELVNNRLVLNPGEACGYLTGRRTAAIIDIDRLQYEIIELS